MARASYSRWDGSQEDGELDGDDVLRRLLDDLLEHGDADQALRRLVQQGFRDRAGRDVAGLRELLDRVRRQRARLARNAFSELQTAISKTPPEVLDARAGDAGGAQPRWSSAAGQARTSRPSFDQFMDRTATSSPAPRPTLTNYWPRLARQMAAARALLGCSQRGAASQVGRALRSAPGGRRRPAH